MNVDSIHAGATDDEEKLHNEIIAICRYNGWLAFYGSMAHRTARVLGEPDFLILLPDGGFLMIECKTKTGKLSDEQLGIVAWANKLGHEVYVVRCVQEFREILMSRSIEWREP